MSCHLTPFHYFILYSYFCTCLKNQGGYACSTTALQSLLPKFSPFGVPAPLFSLWLHRDLKSLDSTFVSKSMSLFLTLLTYRYIVSTPSACSLICPSDAKALKILSFFQLTKPHFRLVFPENNRVIIYRLPVSDALHLPFISNTVLHLV